MSNNSSSPNLWSLLKWGAFAIFPPLATTVPTVQQLTHHNIWLTSTLILLYELTLGLIYLLTKVWQRLEEPWTQKVADVIDRQTRMTLSRYHFHYCRFFRYAHQDVDVKGISGQGPYTLDLGRVFVDVRIAPIPPDQASANPVRTPVSLPTGNHSIWMYLQAEPLRDQQLVILGAPGSGKTTLLKHLGLTLVQHPRPRHLTRFPRLLPILLFLREHSTIIAQKGSDYTLAQAVRTLVHTWQRPMPSGWIEQQLARGRCLVLLDGLDEIADATQRRSVIQWVEQQMVSYAGNRFVVTSRPYGYRSNPLSSVTALEVQPFTFAQIAQFVTNWYLANEIKSAVRDDSGVRLRAQEKAEDLIRWLRNNEALLEMATNPLLLSMIATIHRYRDSLPDNRITLYKEICEVLLGKRQEARGIVQDLRADQRQFVLQSLAYQMMLHGKREITATEAEQIIAIPLQQVSADISSKQFLNSIENNSGLLVEGEQGVYSFAHLSFQEYLVAMYIRENNLERELLTRVENNWWHETIRLYSAQADATTIISACLLKASTSVDALTLALDCMPEARNVQTKVRQRVQTMIELGVEDRDPARRRIVAEALLSQRLHQKMHPVNERISIDTTLVTHAEYQIFLDEERVQGKYFQPDHWISESFPPKTGGLPALGISQTDALSFCAWLTARNESLWQYRLPSHEEWKQNMIGTWREPNEVGFWANEKDHFIWAKGMAPSSLQTQYEHVCGMVIDASLNFDPASALAFLRALTHVFTPFPNQDITLVLAHILNLELARASALALVRQLDQMYTQDLAFDLNHVRDCIPDLIQNLDYNHTHAFALTCDLARTLAHSRTYTSTLDNALNLAAHIYAILFFLQQRREGILPTYEGILLVKERKETV